MYSNIKKIIFDSKAPGFKKPDPCLRRGDMPDKRFLIEFKKDQFPRRRESSLSRALLSRALLSQAMMIIQMMSAVML